MNHTKQRERLRAILAGSECVSPASVYDPLSARVAESVGFQTGFLLGSLASSAILGAPDWVVLTLTELASQLRRITRASTLSIMVDADHGYGNALNVMRAVQELEHAGVSALTIEDTALPLAFGQVLVGERATKGGDQLISIEEGIGKMRAALAARGDPSLVIIARTSALNIEGIEGAVARARAYAEVGVDAIFLAGRPETLEDIGTVHAAVRLPIMVGLVPAKREELSARGVRISLQGQQPVAAAVKALRAAYAHLCAGGKPEDLKSQIAATDEIDLLVNGARYRQWLNEYER